MSSDWWRQNKQEEENPRNMITTFLNAASSKRDLFTDVTFIFSDKTELRAHKLILALVSPRFEALFFGPFAEKGKDLFEVTDVDGPVFRAMIDYIYGNGYVEEDETAWEESIKYTSFCMDLAKLLEAAHLYLVEGLMKYCEEALEKTMGDLLLEEFTDDFIILINRAAGLSIYEEFLKESIHHLLDNLSWYMDQGYWDKLSTAAIAGVSQESEHLERNMTRCIIDSKHNLNIYLEDMESKERFVSKLKEAKEDEKLMNLIALLSIDESSWSQRKMWITEKMNERALMLNIIGMKNRNLHTIHQKYIV